MTSSTFASTSVPLEAKFIQDLITKQKLINLYLTNGVRLQGYVVGYDKYTLLFKSDSNSSTTQLIYKHAIATVLTAINNNHRTNTTERTKASSNEKFEQ